MALSADTAGITNEMLESVIRELGADCLVVHVEHITAKLGTMTRARAPLPPALLEGLGRQVVRQGAAGAGQHAKMVNQILIASTMVGVCEGLLYAVRAGLDPETVIGSVGAGAAGSWSINNLGPRMIRRDFEPGFYVEHFLKDLGIALDESARVKLLGDIQDLWVTESPFVPLAQGALFVAYRDGISNIVLDPLALFHYFLIEKAP